MIKSRAYWLLIVIIIIAIFLRLYQITTTPPGLYPDEAMNGSNAQEALATGEFKVFYPENNGREGLFMNIQAMFLKFVGANEPWVLRFPSALFGIFTVLGIYFLARELFRKEVALLAAFLLATSFWHIMFSRIGFRAIMAPFFIVWALYFLLRGYRAIREKMPFRRTTIFHIVGGITFGLGFYSYIAYRVTPALILLVMLFYFMMSCKEKWQKAFFHASAHFVFFALVATVPLASYYLNNPADFLGRASQVSVFSSATPVRDLAWNTIKTTAMFNVVGDWNQRHNDSGRPALFWPVGIFFVIGFITGIREVWRDRRNLVRLKSGVGSGNEGFSFLIVFALFALAFLPVVISNEGLPHALRSILLIPPAIILAAIGGCAIYRWIERRWGALDWERELASNPKPDYPLGDSNQGVPNDQVQWWQRQWQTSAFGPSYIVKKIGLKIPVAIFLIILAFEAYHTYFITWANNPNTPGAFAADYVALGRELNALTHDAPKYVVVEAGGVLVRGIPMPSQTVMFITDTFTPKKQTAKNVYYVLPRDESSIPVGALRFELK